MSIIGVHFKKLEEYMIYYKQGHFKKLGNLSLMKYRD